MSTSKGSDLMTAQSIHPSKISCELKRIWNTLDGTNKMRASLFNLIFYTKAGAREQYIRTISEKVVEKFPSRIIFITEGNDTEDHLHTSVSVMSSQQAQSDIACDAIHIDVCGSYAERVPFVILPHILPDLPVYVIWAEDPCLPSPLFDQLQPLASRIIFDSESISNLTQFAKRLTAFGIKHNFDIADLNWARTESWRELLASAFHSQERLCMLAKASRIQICYNSLKTKAFCHTSIQSLYLQKWLATQMDWTLEALDRDHQKWTLTYRGKNGPITVTLFPENLPNFKPGAIISVDLETSDQDHFSFGCSPTHPHLVSMRFSTLDRCDMPLNYIFGKEESGRSLVKEICHRGTSRHFFDLLRRLSSQTHQELSLCES